MRKKSEKSIILALVIIFNLILSIMALSFILASFSIVVSAADAGTHEVQTEKAIQQTGLAAASTQTTQPAVNRINIKPARAPPKPTSTTTPPPVGDTLDLPSPVSEVKGSSQLSELLQIRAVPDAGVQGSHFFSWYQGGLADAFLSGVQYAAIAYGVGQLIGSVAGLEDEETESLSIALAAGAGVGKMAAVLFTEGGSLAGSTPLSSGLWGGAQTGTFAGPGALGIGLIVAAVVFVLIYKEVSTKKAVFQCNVWDPPSGGEDCEKCNADDINFPCTEYKCKSLGAGCELLNEESAGEEKCIWKDPKDVNSPIITPYVDALSEGYRYTGVQIRPPGLGMEIVKQDGDCIEAFFPLEFGVSTNEATQCRISYNHTKTFDDMSYSFGGSSTYKYNHSQLLSLPGPVNIEQELDSLEVSEEDRLIIENDGIYTLFVRCSDANGNYNVDEYAIKFCVDAGPDTTPPRIESTSLENGAPVSFDQEELDLKVYVNEPADCKWSREDKDYDVMENIMSCSSSITEVNLNMLYECSTTLTGIKNRQENKYYFRCKDQPLATSDSDRNKNQESYLFTVIGTQPLNIIDFAPNGTIEGSTSQIEISLEVETANGYSDGDAICYYSRTGNEQDWIQFFETGSYLHKQRQDLLEGTYTYYFKCVDLGGNADYDQTTFTVFIDNYSPEIVRVYHDSGDSSVCGGEGCLKIMTDEKSTCSYSTTTCNFEIDNGILMPYADTSEHYAEWKTEFNYYIKCKDDSDNQPLPTDCSIVVRPYNER